MSLLAFFHGGGRRRRSTENWDDLQRKLSDAQACTAKVKGAHRSECAAAIHPPFWVYTETRLPCPWCEIDRLRGQIQLLVTRPTPRPGGITVMAPADGSRIAVPKDEPVTDVNAKTQAVDVAELRNAMGEGDTRTLPVVSPVVPVEPTPRVSWGVPAGPGSSSPTELSPTTGRRAVVNVATALDEAS